MKKISFLIFIFLLPIICLGQPKDYEQEMASFIVKFKTISKLEKDRKIVYEDVKTLYDEIETHKQIIDPDNPNYRSLELISKKVDALWSYIGCFANLGLMKFEEFGYINGLMNVYPQKIDNLKCESIEFYEIKIGSFRAIMIHNILIPNYDSYPMDLKTIEVKYYAIDNSGKYYEKGTINVGGGEVRCLIDSNDDGSLYNISSIECRRL